VEAAMAEFRSYQDIESQFARLLGDLGGTWARKDIVYVQDLIGHAEYGEALDNLIAIGRNAGHPFSGGQMAQIQALARAMGIDLSGRLQGAA